MNNTFEPQEGGCTCGNIRYRMMARPMIIHCCHCTWCQRETGSAFALNALIEAHQVELIQGQPETLVTPSNSGQGQAIVRCPECKVAVWSNYAAAKDAVHFLRVGTLDNSNTVQPDIHIFTSSKLDWVTLPDDIPAVEEYYQRSKYWPAESVDRYKKALGR